MIRRLRLAVVLVVSVFVFAPLAQAAVSVERVTSPGGIEVWLVQDHTNPIIAMNFAFDGGAAFDPKDRLGLANMTAALLDEGAGDLDSQAFQGRLEDLAVKLSFNAGRDSFGGSLQTLTKNRDQAAAMLALALTKPRFDAEPVERVRRQILVGINQAKEDPTEVAGERLMATLFPDHPYGRPAEGTAETVEAITADDLQGFVASRLARQGLYIGLVGDISPAEAGAFVDQAFGGLPAKAGDQTVAEVTPTLPGGLVVQDMDVPQSAISLATLGPKRNDPDYYAATVLNYVLGGGSFASRLFDEVREKRGLAYSVYTYLYPLDHTGMIAGGVATANARAAETVEVLTAEWQRMYEGGITEDELRDAVTYLTGSFALRFSSSSGVASILVGMQMEDLGIDYLDRRNALIEAVTLADVAKAAKAYLDPKKLTMVVVGKPDGLKP